MRNITDYLKVFKNINKQPGTMVAELTNMNTPDLEQSPDSFLKPGETLEDWDVSFRRPNAEGGFQQLVTPSVDGSRPGYEGVKKLKTPYDYKYSGVFKMKTGENKGKYTFEIRNPDYTGKGSNEPAKIKIGPFDNETDAIKAYQERQAKMGEIKLAGPQTKVTEQTKAINNFVTNFYEKNLNNFELRDYQSFEKKLIEEFEKSGIKDLGSKRKALNFGFPNVGKHAEKKASKIPFTLYGMDARTPSGLNLQTDAQSFFKKAFYSGKLKNNPELVGKLRRYLEYYNADRSKGKYHALEAKYADVLDPKVKSDLIYFLESDQIGTGNLRSNIIKQYLPDEYRKYVDKKNASGIRYQELMKKIQNSLIEKGYKKQLTTALNGTTSIKTFMQNQTDLLNKIFDTSELKKAGYSELIFNADHLEGIAEIAQMDNADDQIRALRNLVGTTSEINKELGLEGFSSKRKSLMQNIKNGTNVEANIDELNKITKAAYPQFEGDLYKYNPATKSAVPTKNFIFNYDPETAFRQYFNELVKHPVGSKILKKQYLDKPELQKVINKDPKLKNLLNTAKTAKGPGKLKALNALVMMLGAGTVYKLGFSPTEVKASEAQAGETGVVDKAKSWPIEHPWLTGGAGVAATAAIPKGRQVLGTTLKGFGKGLGGIDLPLVQAAFAYDDPKNLAYSLPFTKVAADVTGITKPAATKAGQVAKNVLSGIGPKRLAKYALPVSRISTPFGLGMAMYDIAKHSKPNYYIDPQTQEPTFYDRENASDVLPTMMDIYDQAYKIAEEKGISYQEALQQIDASRFYDLNKASGGRAGYMGGGMAGIRRPHAIPPKRQGLRSIMINGKKY